MFMPRFLIQALGNCSLIIYRKRQGVCSNYCLHDLVSSQGSFDPFAGSESVREGLGWNDKCVNTGGEISSLTG